MNQTIRRLTFVLATNIWSPHMVPLGRELFSILGSNFKMVLFERTHQERLKTGWNELDERPIWLAGPPESQSEFQNLDALCQQADVALCGAVPAQIMDSRAATGKLTFVVAERMLKKPFHRLRMLNPRYANGIRQYCRRMNHPNLHALAIGHYAPGDLQRLGVFGDKIWHWAYFVDLNPDPPRPRIGKQLRVLWVGRMLQLKRVDVVIQAASRIQHEPWFGGCLIVGEGPERSALVSLSRKLRIREEALAWKPPVPIAEVRQLMREHDVCVLSSNRHEGWGAVAGEAMSEGCLLVANEQAGAARTLVCHGETGLLFADGDVGGLVANLTQLAQNPDQRERLRQAAWRAVHDSWSAKVGAERVVRLAQDLLDQGDSDRYLSGLCSRCSMRKKGGEKHD
jgi:glycosyltransferase involved in cell wall biosynthesis